MHDRIKRIRADLKLTQSDFAAKLGVSQNYVWMLESGERTASDRIIRDICREFRVDETWLRTGEGDMYRPRSREQELGEGIRAILIDRPESFQAALISTLLKFDPDGPEWAALERIMAELQKETKKDPEP